MGRSDRTAPARRRNASAFSSCDHSDTSRALFYGTHKVSSCSSVSGYGKSGYRQKNKRKGFSVSHAVPDRFYCHTSGNGKPGGRGGSHFCRRSRSCVLDVGNSLIGSSTAFIEGTLAQLYKEKDPLYGGYRGGPAYYIHKYLQEKRGGKVRRYCGLSVLFAISGLICWCGISQVISNSVSSAFENAFHIPPLYSTIALVVLAAVIVLRKNATVKVLDVMVPIMAGCYLLITVLLIVINFRMIPSVIGRIFQEAFGFRQVVAGGFGAVLMNGIKRGLFSNEAGSGSAPCAAATAETDHPAKVGLGQALGVFIDTILICSCTAMIMLLTPETLTQGLTGMDLLQEAMRYHLGTFGVVFIAITLWLFSFSTFVGILFYARSNVAYLFGDNWFSQTAYKIVALAMLFVGGLAAYTVVWDLGDVGVGLMTLFNIFILFPMSKKAIDALKDYEKKKKA